MPEKRFLGIKECSQYFDVPAGTFYAWTHLRKIPHHKLGKLVKFNLQDLEI
jgi:excisionase family DNA binding protein